jgi:peptide methionine sulfoxide reductase MsrA
MIGNNFQEKVHIKFQKENINYIALISIDFQEKLHLRFQEENISFTALISIDFQEKLPSQISRGKHQLHSIDRYK